MSRRQGGFSLVEILVALAVGAIVIVGMYQAFNILHKSWISVGVTSDQRQNARAGLEMVTRDFEMAGYQTTNYGDPNNKTGLAITLAAVSEIEMDQQRPDSATISTATPVYAPRLVYYHLATDMKTGRQNLYRQIRTQPGLSAPDEIVAENVSAFTLGYLDKDNNKFKDPADPADPANLPNPPYKSGTLYAAGTIPAGYVFGTPPPAVLKGIRRIQVTLTTVPARSMPFGPQGQPFTLMASVIPQNLAAADEVPADITPPAVPTGLAVIDTCSCSDKLRVKWNRNAEPDRAGYILFYGATGSFNVPVRALVDKNNPEITLNPSDLFITKNAARTTVPNTYWVQIAAYDAAGNHSAKSAAVSGNPNPDVKVFGGANDTTVNPCKPSVPTGLSVAQGAGDGELVVTWQVPADNSATAGYRLYRSTTPFVTGHISDSLLIAGESAINAETTSWTDRNLVGCRTYYYAIASVNCDDTLVAGYAYDSGNAAASDYAVASGSPRDTVAPPAPGFACSPGVQAVNVTLTNPVAALCPDCDRTEIFWSTTGAPHFDGTTVSGGTLLPDSDSGSPGTFRNRGSQVIVFDSETAAAPPNPSLAACSTYDLLAVSFDQCGNASPAVGCTNPAQPGCQTPGCTDTPPGPPPDLFGNPSIISCQPDSVVLGWSYPGKETVADLAGFRVSRTGPQGTVELTAGPTSTPSWTDISPLTAGSAYSYSITATDCIWEQYLRNLVPQPYIAALSALTLGPIYPGVVRPYQRSIASSVAYMSSAVSSGDGTIPIVASALNAGFANSGQLSIGCYRVSYTGVSYSGTIPGAFTGCTWPAASTGYTAPASTPVYQYDAAAYAAPENFVTSISDASRPYSYHNNVKFYLQNTSMTSMMIKNMAVTWDNPNVTLTSVTIGGPPSGTSSRTVTTGGVASGVPFTVGVEITDRASGVGVPSGAVPVVLRFTTPNGSVNRLTDMRNETLTIALWGWNPSYVSAECVIPVRFAVDVPRGPMLGGFSQSAPGLYGIDSYEVIGASATARDTDVKVPYGIDVNVYGTVFDNSREIAPDFCNMGYASGYPKVVGISAAAASPAAIPAMPATGSFFELPLLNISGDRYTIYRTSPAVSGSLMPQASDKVIWYDALAVDATGNWDRVPNPDNGDYAYFQPPFDVCSVTPQAPVLTLVSSTATQANLAWTAPTAYDNGLAIVATDTIAYDVYVKTAGGAPWPSTPISANQAGLTFTHNADLLAGTYYYMVRARNSCPLGPRTSVDSNVVMECMGATGLDCSLLNVPATGRYGEPLTFTVSDFCSYRGNGLADSVVFRVQSGVTTTDFTSPETGDTGAFAKTITPVWSGSGTNVVAAPSGTLNVNLVVGGTTPCAAKTVTLTGAACYTTPNPPTNVTAVRGLSGSNAAVLTWVKPNYNVDGTPLTDLAGYQVDLVRCTNWNSGLGNCDMWSGWSSVDLNDPAAQAHTVSGLIFEERYKFRVRAKDSCATPNTSAWSAESSLIRIR